MHAPVELKKAYRLLNHGPTVLVSSTHQGRQDIMAVAWSMPLDFNPPKISLVIDKNSYTREIIEASGELAISVPSHQQAGLTLALGSCSGRQYDKFSRYNVPHFAASCITAPLIEGCLAWLECRLIVEPHIQNTYDLLIAEVVAAWADPEVFQNGHWNNDAKKHSLHYIAGGMFFAASETLMAEPIAPHNDKA